MSETLVNKQAPDFTLQNENGEQVSLSDFRGKKVILYFYPKDMTPGCTTEACDFRDSYESFADLNAVILGVSGDSAERHKKFIEKYDLPFSLLVDEDHEVCQKYGVWVLKKNYGKEYMGIERSTFLIDENGIVLKEWRKVRVKNHIQEVLNYLRELEGE
ncbi:thioredoxin-dependent thiol peroxidase [Ureibacillus sp. FSL K6-8385]|uniref:thioredoxin-dependent peroxiredoxin n=1 Tax=Ureibacillus terrenus TaxID=118246 RepID=A0A540V334_9BACL|nr:thioredoxin-dependent thiol peroxidase [Ureibacillus terrenus]MED3662799.1 thioredoxin-dependent thiol peroxidase [Ureibacillus terrenus]MED3763728.1 thioredoxin-dependent thiol peroxidase [Ureibacillus terrenus]TQE91147.1 thioredoxin-dependent thiol peroxidase [Ureibacillus terrenus]